MKKIFILFLLLSITRLISAQDAKTVFSAMPDSLSPILTTINRADFVDFMENNMTAKVKNKFEGESEMTALTDTYIKIRTTDKSTWEMKLLPVNDTVKVISVVSTACGPACDSSVRFYSTNWKELPSADYLTLPGADNFFLTPATDKQNEYNLLRQKADIFLMKAELDSDTNKITFTYTTPDYMDKDDQEKIKQYIKSPVVYNWGNGRFR